LDVYIVSEKKFKIAFSSFLNCEQMVQRTDVGKYVSKHAIP